METLSRKRAVDMVMIVELGFSCFGGIRSFGDWVVVFRLFSKSKRLYLSHAMCNVWIEK